MCQIFFSCNSGMYPIATELNQMNLVHHFAAGSSQLRILLKAYESC